MKRAPEYGDKSPESVLWELLFAERVYAEQAKGGVWIAAAIQRHASGRLPIIRERIAKLERELGLSPTVATVDGELAA